MGTTIAPIIINIQPISFCLKPHPSSINNGNVASKPEKLNVVKNATRNNGIKEILLKVRRTASWGDIHSCDSVSDSF